MRRFPGLTPTLRHAIAVTLLPFMVTVLMPVWIARRYATVPTPGTSAAALIVQGAGIAVLLAGVALFVSSLRRFAGEGDGTLAPWVSGTDGEDA